MLKEIVRREDLLDVVEGYVHDLEAGTLIELKVKSLNDEREVFWISGVFSGQKYASKEGFRGLKPYSDEYHQALNTVHESLLEDLRTTGPIAPADLLDMSQYSQEWSSAVMWNMINMGDLELSPEWKISIKEEKDN